MYKFLKVQTCASCPGVVGWWLQVDPHDLVTEGQLHESVAHRNYKTATDNPHFNKDDPWQNPITLTQKWLQGKSKISQMAIKMGHSLLVNDMGGMCDLSPSMIVLETRESESLVWPKMEEKPEERIKITRYPTGGAHFYLSSNTGRLFAPKKYSTFEAARRVALMYVPEGKITADIAPRESAEGE
jgi:hypothetical protein